MKKQKLATIWKNCMMKNYYPDDTGMDASTCDVRISGKDLVISYYEEDTGKAAVWKGTDQGQGHYTCRFENGEGEASLHRFPNGGFLEGWWLERGHDGSMEEGMWRIELIK